MAFEPDDQQARVLAHRHGPLLVTGPAGTGKTAVLQERFARLVEEGADPERVVLVVGSAHLRDRSRRALLQRLRASLPRLGVHTWHGLAHRIVSLRFRDLGYGQPPRVLSAADQFARVRELLEDEDPAHWPAYGSMLTLRGFADEVRQLLLRAQEALLKPDDIEARARAAGLTGWRELARFYARYLEVLDREGAVDFAGLVERAAAAAGRDPGPFEHVLVDDYHDATLAQEALLASLAPASLVVAGDPEAHVFSFQGTTDVPLRRFPQRFAGTEVVRLSVRHRGGDVTVEAWSAPHRSEEHAAVARELRRIHVEEHVPWGQLAVVVRRQADDLGGLLRSLDDAGVPRVVPERGLSVTVEPATAPFVLALRWLARPEERDELVEALLTSDLARLSPPAARGLMRAARVATGRPAEALSRDEGLSPAEAEAVASLRAALERAQTVADRSALDAFRILWQELPCSARLVAAARTDPRAHRELDAVVALARAIEELGADRPVAALLEALEDGGEGPGLSGPDTAPDDAVHVLTAHGAVGREFHTVMVVGAVEGNFPSLWRPEPMFDLSALDGPVPRSDRNRQRLADERRLFRSVLGRARARVVLTASDSHGEAGREAAPSRFVAELGVQWVPAPPVPQDEPVSVAEAAAAWRRELADHTAPAPRRLAALEGLLALGVDPSRWWFQRDWTDSPEPLHPVVQVSYSRLDTLENCELQYVLREELGLGRPAGYHAWVGKLVHRLVEDCENGLVERSLDALVREAERRWRPEEFPSLAVSEAHRRLVVDRMLPNWFARYGNEPALAQEVRFAFELEGARVTGYIDRIGPILSGGNVITDLKTGKPERADRAEDSLQLGIYYLAVQEAAELAPYQPVRAVELAFLRGRGRGDRLEPRRWQWNSRSEEEYQRKVRERLRGLIRRVRALGEATSFRPDPAADCFYCEFRTLCPLWPEGASLFPVTGAGAEAGGGP